MKGMRYRAMLIEHITSSQDFTVTTLEECREKVRADFETIPVDDTLAKFDKSIEVSDIDRLLQRIDDFFLIPTENRDEQLGRCVYKELLAPCSKVKTGLIDRQNRDGDFGG